MSNSRMLVLLLEVAKLPRREFPTPSEANGSSSYLYASTREPRWFSALFLVKIMQQVVNLLLFMADRTLVECVQLLYQVIHQGPSVVLRKQICNIFDVVIEGIFLDRHTECECGRPSECLA